MKKQGICEKERRGIKRLEAIKLPHNWKKIGIILLIFTFIGLFLLRFFDGPQETVKFIIKRTMLISFLIIALSREKVEDEMIRNLRGQAFSLAFIWGVLYSFFQPAANYVVDHFLNKNASAFSELGGFQILWFMLAVYVLLFHYFKRLS